MTRPAAVNATFHEPDLQPEIEKSDVARQIFSNSVAQLIGRFAVAATRFVMVAAIVRSGGKTLFAQYSIVLGVLSLGEWLVDFGTTDAFTREVCREPERAQKLLRTLTGLKIVQFPLAILLLFGMLLLFHYPTVVVQAGLVGGASLLWFSGILVYRVVFRSQMRVERDVLAEFISVAFLVPVTLVICHYRLGLIAIFWAYFFSRIVFLGCCILLGQTAYRLSLHDVALPDISWSVRTSFAIGIAGFLAVGYETTDILLLSRFGTVSDTALYSAAQKLVTPVMMAVAAVGSTFYPVFARFWPKHPHQFEAVAQRALNLVLLLAGFCVVPLIAGADFFMPLLAKQLVDGAPALRGMAVLCFLKTITLTLGPILYIVFAQRQLLKMVAVALILKAILIVILVPRFGYLAVIGTSIGLEIFFSIITVGMIRHFTGWTIRWVQPICVTAALAASVLVPAAAHLRGLVASSVGLVLYTIAVLSIGIVKIADIRQLLDKKQAIPASASMASST